MESGILQHFRDNLERQRQNLLEWLRGTTLEKKQIYLGPVPVGAVQTRLETIDDAIARADQRTLGLCNVCHEDVEVDRLELDFTACVCIDHYSEDQKRRLEQDLELSHKVQRAMLPKESPAIPGMQLAAFLQPAEIVGGDYFDFFRFRNGSYGLAIADVMGKGLPASMLVASMQASLRILVPENDSPADVVKRLNDLFSHNIHLIKFISIFLGRYDPDTHLLEYCNAGHNPPIYLRTIDGSHTIVRLRPTGPAIGLTESYAYSNASVQMSKGDLLLLYTDGATESYGKAKDEEFGEQRLADWLKANAHHEPTPLINRLRLTLRDFAGTSSLQDDMTLVAAKVTA